MDLGKVMRKINYEPLSNRQKSKTAGLGLSWCPGCDRDKVGDGQKCKTCGYHHKPKKIR